MVIILAGCEPPSRLDMKEAGDAELVPSRMPRIVDNDVECVRVITELSNFLGLLTALSVDVYRIIKGVTGDMKHKKNRKENATYLVVDFVAAPSWLIAVATANQTLRKARLMAAKTKDASLKGQKLSC